MKALWAFEPFHQDTTKIKDMYNLLKQLVAHRSNIEIGYIVTTQESEQSEKNKVKPKEKFNGGLRNILKTKLKNAQCLIDDKNIHLVEYQTTSNKKAVDRLLELNENCETNLIALYTHARQGFLRLAIGSFAETIIHRSKTSLLLMNPTTKCSKNIKQILYSHDFSQLSNKHLKKVIEICQVVKANLTVFHQAQAIYKWSFDESNRKIINYRKNVDQVKNMIEEECRLAKIPFHVIISTEISSTTDLIINTSSKVKADLIIVCAKSGPMAALMGGSTTRQIIRESQKPILVLK
jgi:nucleotide-binding universal stress UspA family protein